MYCHQEKEYLPGSIQRYSVDKKGVIRDGETVLDIVKKENGRYVLLDWTDGLREYKYDAIIVFSYFKAKVPLRHDERISLIFKDGDSGNLSIENLSYKFTDGPIESDVFPGYYHVPFYTDYLVNRSGEVISMKLFRRKGISSHKKWTVSKPVIKKNIKGGYYCGRGRRDHDGVDGVSRHRFIALTFIPYEKDPLSLTVNHKDGIPGNDREDNLEWVTYSQNTLHAYQNNLYSNKTVGIIYRNDKTGFEKRYPTITSCAVENGFTFGFIAARLARPNFYYTDGLRFKHDNESKWEVDLIVKSPTVIRAVAARNVMTGDVFIFENHHVAAKNTAVSSGTVRNHCLGKTFSPSNGYNFRYADDVDTFPEYTEYHRRMYARHSGESMPFGIFLLDDSNQIIALYETFEDHYRCFGVSRRLLKEKINANEKIGGYRCRWFDASKSM